MFKLIFSMAMLSLIVLVIQNSLLVVMTRFSRKNVDATHNYYTSTLVLNQECVKMLMCLVIYGCDDVWKQYHHHFSSTASFSAAIAVEDREGEGEAAEDGAAFTPRCQKNSAAADARSETEPSRDAEQQEVEAAAAAAAAAAGPRGSNADELSAVVVVASAATGAKHSEDDTASAAAPAVPAVAAAAAQNAVRRGVRVGAPSPHPAGAAAVSGSAPASSKPTTSTIPRKNKVRFVWMRVQAASLLYCSMLRVAVLKRDTLKLLVPAFLFNMQNFLIFVGLSNLDAVSFQVWSQTKLLSTALFSVWLLHRKLSPMQWLSLVALTAGVLGAQLGASKSNAGASVGLYTTSVAPTKGPRVVMLKAQSRLTRAVFALAGNEHQVGGGDGDGDDESQANAMIGIVACVLSGLSSSYAGVYFEKVVKTTSPTLSIRNIQLSIFGIPFAFLSMLFLDVFPRWYQQRQCGDPVHWNIFRNPFLVDGKGQPQQFGTNGDCPVQPFYFWQRYDHLLTWGLVGIHAFGGLLVAIVVKYADNILKGFATGVAVIVSGMMSSVIWGYKPTVAFVLGAVLVIGSSIMFHKFEPKR